MTCWSVLVLWGYLMLTGYLDVGDVTVVNKQRKLGEASLTFRQGCAVHIQCTSSTSSPALSS